MTVGKYRTSMNFIVPNVMVRQLDALGEVVDPGRVMTEQKRRDKMVMFALNELFKASEGEVRPG